VHNHWFFRLVRPHFGALIFVLGWNIEGCPAFFTVHTENFFRSWVFLPCFTLIFPVLRVEITYILRLWVGKRFCQSGVTHLSVFGLYGLLSVSLFQQGFDPCFRFWFSGMSASPNPGDKLQGPWFAGLYGAFPPLWVPVRSLLRSDSLWKYFPAVWLFVF